MGVVLLLTLAGALKLAACGNGAPSNDASLSGVLTSADSSDIAGSVSVESAAGAARLEIEVAGLPAGQYRAWLRAGSCDDPLADAADLGPLFSNGTLPTGRAGPSPLPVEELAAGWHVEIVRSASGGQGERVACGELTTPPA